MSATTNRQHEAALPPPIVENVPDWLKDRAFWLNFRRTPDATGKLHKTYYNTERPDQKIGLDDAKWLRPLDQALAALEDRDRRFHGIGYNVGLDLDVFGIDRDRCYTLLPDADDPDAEPERILASWAAASRDEFPTYTEASISGTGEHSIGRARTLHFRGADGKPLTLRQRGKLGPEQDGKIEVFVNFGALTVTGRRVLDQPPDVRDLHEDLDLFLTSLAGQQPGQDYQPVTGLHTDDWVISKAIMERHRPSWAGGRTSGEVFADVFLYGKRGLYSVDESAEDFWVEQRLAFYAGPDPETLERLMRTKSHSGFRRSKWDDRRGSRTWLARDIDRALRLRGPADYHFEVLRALGAGASRNGQPHEGNGRHYAGPGGGAHSKTDEDQYKWVDDGDVATLADVKREIGETRYLWDKWVPFGNITAIIARAGLGKTRFVLGLAWCLWFNELFPDGSPNPLPARTPTLWLCYDRHWWGLIETAKAFGLPEEAILLPTRKGKPLFIPDFDDVRTMPLLERIIRARHPGFVAIDTTTYATRYDTARANETKIAYDPIMGVMAETRTACLALTHLNREGTILNRRLEERARVVIKLSQPDENQPNRIKVAVDKTDDRKPAPIGMTFTDGRNEYDDRPPRGPQARPAADQINRHGRLALELPPDRPRRGRGYRQRRTRCRAPRRTDGKDPQAVDQLALRREGPHPPPSSGA